MCRNVLCSIALLIILLSFPPTSHCHHPLVLLLPLSSTRHPLPRYTMSSDDSNMRKPSGHLSTRRSQRPSPLAMPQPLTDTASRADENVLGLGWGLSTLSVISQGGYTASGSPGGFTRGLLSDHESGNLSSASVPYREDNAAPAPDDSEWLHEPSVLAPDTPASSHTYYLDEIPAQLFLDPSQTNVSPPMPTGHVLPGNLGSPLKFSVSAPDSPMVTEEDHAPGQPQPVAEHWQTPASPSDFPEDGSTTVQSRSSLKHSLQDALESPRPIQTPSLWCSRSSVSSGSHPPSTPPSRNSQRMRESSRQRRQQEGEAFNDIRQEFGLKGNKIEVLHGVQQYMREYKKLAEEAKAEVLELRTEMAATPNRPRGRPRLASQQCSADTSF
ncbi:hypothetical protein BC834DRAFT_388479 [Gloeopeniophorella convolvens]|nr:hypothetical protein BC834DRAFT_388479 [Gloeopeniophorella convolvens]